MTNASKQKFRVGLGRIGHALESFLLSSCGRGQQQHLCVKRIGAGDRELTCSVRLACQELLWWKGHDLLAHRRQALQAPV
jgi:hypothetical protein